MKKSAVLLDLDGTLLDTTDGVLESAVHGADNFNRLTKADIVEMCFMELDVNRKGVVIVGDTEHDAVGAANASVDFIGVTFGFGFRTESDVGRYPNIGCIGSLEQIVELIV